MKKNEPFSYQSQGQAETIVADIATLSKPIKKFLLTLFSQWWSILGRYNFINMSRYMNYSEQALRNGFEREIDFFQINTQLVKQHCFGELLLVFDASFISKSGKKTYGLGQYWSGKDQKAKKGLELGCLAVVDVENTTAFHLACIQTPPMVDRKQQNKTLIDHYRDFILDHLQELKQLSPCLAVDGYFMKQDFILPVVEKGLTIITKMRSDANLNYIYKGEQHKGRGRKKTNAGKVNWKKLDKNHWKRVFSTKTEVGYTATLHCIALKRVVRIVYYLDKKTNNHQIFLCTDIQRMHKRFYGIMGCGFRSNF